MATMACSATSLGHGLESSHAGVSRANALDRSALILTASDAVGRSSAGVAVFGCGVLNYASSPRDRRLLPGGDTPKQRKL